MKCFIEMFLDTTGKSLKSQKFFFCLEEKTKNNFDSNEAFLPAFEVFNLSRPLSTLISLRRIGFRWINLTPSLSLPLSLSPFLSPTLIHSYPVSKSSVSPHPPQFTLHMLCSRSTAVKFGEAAVQSCGGVPG